MNQKVGNVSPLRARQKHEDDCLWMTQSHIRMGIHEESPVYTARFILKYAPRDCPQILSFCLKYFDMLVLILIVGCFSVSVNDGPAVGLGMFTSFPYNCVPVEMKQDREKLGKFLGKWNGETEARKFKNAKQFDKRTGS